MVVLNATTLDVFEKIIDIENNSIENSGRRLEHCFTQVYLKRVKGGLIFHPTVQCRSTLKIYKLIINSYNYQRRCLCIVCINQNDGGIFRVSQTTVKKSLHISQIWRQKNEFVMVYLE
jgi:hypothetical protein